MEVSNLPPSMAVFRSSNVADEAEVVEVNFIERCAVLRAGVKKLTSEAGPKAIVPSTKRPYT